MGYVFANKLNAERKPRKNQSVDKLNTKNIIPNLQPPKTTTMKVN